MTKNYKLTVRTNGAFYEGDAILTDEQKKELISNFLSGSSLTLWDGESAIVVPADVVKQSILLITYKP